MLNEEQMAGNEYNFSWISMIVWITDVLNTYVYTTTNYKLIDKKNGWKMFKTNWIWAKLTMRMN